MMGRRPILALAVAVSFLIPRATALADEPAPQRAPIINGSVAVQAMGYIAYPVEVDLRSMSSPRIVGHVTASGGTGNDIEVVVFTTTQYVNWKNSHKGGSLFTSGQVTACDLDVPLRESGTYYVLLSNVFSGFTAKTVAGKIDLLWTTPLPTKEEQDAQNALVLTGAGLIVGILLFAAAIGGLIVWLFMLRRKKASAPSSTT